ncbi:MAG: ASPIC/UnbV domain-containing protein, partial [Planctomycetota bacterium]
IVNHGAEPILYRNDSDNSNSYLRIDLEGTLSNRDGIGAWISVTPDLGVPDEKLVWEVDGGSSFLSQNEHTAHFGLGEFNENVDLVQIEWTNGLIQQIFNVEPNQTLNVLETDQAEAADFNGNGVVDAADFTVWRDLLGSTSSVADADGNGLVGMEDFYIWRTQFGRVVPPLTIPEPNTSGLLLLGLAWCVMCCRMQARNRS